MPAEIAETFEVKLKRNLLKYFKLKDNKIIVKVLENSTLSYNYYGYDNWNGGTDLYNITLKIPIELYVELESKFEEIRTEILSKANQLFSTIENERLDSLLIEMRDNEGNNQNPIYKSTMIATDKLAVSEAQELWIKATERLQSGDYPGSVTLARTLLERVIKAVLDDLKICYDDKDELTKIYKLLGDALKLSPNQHTEQIFSQILGGCISVVLGLGSLRNKISDSHAPRIPVKLAKRHAELAVNLAGTIATFLIETWEYNRLKQENQMV